MDDKDDQAQDTESEGSDSGGTINDALARDVEAPGPSSRAASPRTSRPLKPGSRPVDISF